MQKEKENHDAGGYELENKMEKLYFQFQTSSRTTAKVKIGPQKESTEQVQMAKPPKN